MGRVNNLDEDPMVEVMRRLQALERAAPVGFTEISRGALIVTSVAGLIVRGSASVTGILTGIGQLLWSGIVSLTGTVNISGPLGITGTATVAGPLVVNGPATITGPDTKITGPFHVSGNTDISGAVEITGPSTSITGPWHLNGDGDVGGDVTQTGTWTVNAPGQIIIAGDDPITLGAATPFGVGVGFSTGAVLSSTSGGAALYGPGGSAAATVSPSNAVLKFDAYSVIVSATGVKVTAPIVFEQTTGHTGKARFDGAVEMDLGTVPAYGGLPAGVVVINPSTGRLSRTV